MNKVFALLICLCTLNDSCNASEPQYYGLAELNKQQQTKVKAWIEYGFNAVQRSLGLLTQESVPIHLKPQYFALEPVPWAEIVRGNSDGVELQFYRYASLEQLKSDWTLYHELAHLYHPLLYYRDFWISEGLATYLQNIIMRNEGIISHQNMVVRMKAGLARGRSDTQRLSGQTNPKLSEVSRNMWQLRAQQRVYWSGVAFFIEAQYQLKQHASDYKTISELIKVYQLCCKTNQHQSGLSFLTELDKLSKTAIFSKLYVKYKDRTDFPTIPSLYFSSLINKS